MTVLLAGKLVKWTGENFEEILYQVIPLAKAYQGEDKTLVLKNDTQRVVVRPGQYVLVTESGIVGFPEGMDMQRLIEKQFSVPDFSDKHVREAFESVSSLPFELAKAWKSFVRGLKKLPQVDKEAFITTKAGLIYTILSKLPFSVDDCPYCQEFYAGGCEGCEYANSHLVCSQSNPPSAYDVLQDMLDLFARFITGVYPPKIDDEELELCVKRAEELSKKLKRFKEWYMSLKGE